MGHDGDADALASVYVTSGIDGALALLAHGFGRMR